MYSRLLGRSSRFLTFNTSKLVSFQSKRLFSSSIHHVFSKRSALVLGTTCISTVLGGCILYKSAHASECNDPICHDNINMFKMALDATRFHKVEEKKNDQKDQNNESETITSKSDSNKEYNKDNSVSHPNEFTIENENKYYECPPDRSLLGRHSWTLLHTIAAYYPENPTEEDKKNAMSFIESFAQLYPCKNCAFHFQRLIKETPPNVNSQKEFVMWMAQAHNIISKKCHKPIYPEDYDVLQKRWKTGCDACHPEKQQNEEQFTSEQTLRCEDLAKYGVVPH
ncbi:hypothetical protein WA158_007288 [Blastocystis sp. Blastoise]